VVVVGVGRFTGGFFGAGACGTGDDEGARGAGAM
jgi:hypothetical protein